MFEVSRVVGARSQQNDGWLGAAFGGQESQSRVQLLAVVLNRPHPAFLKQPRKYLLHHSAASENLRNPTGDAEIVLQNHKVSLRVSYQIRTDHRDVDIARYFDTAHFPAVMFAGVNNVSGHDAVFNVFSFMITFLEQEF